MMAFMMVQLVRGGWLPVGNVNHHSFYCELWDYKCISMSCFIYLCLCYRACVFVLSSHLECQQKLE